MLRVISGTVGGQKLKTLRGLETRPTADRVREALFNVLNPRIPKCRFLDLYAGTGAIGIEALSRGADQVVFIDVNPAAVQVIRENLSRMQLLDRAEVICAKLPRGLELVAARGYKFELVFVDPPYWNSLGEPTLNKLSFNNLLAAEGWVVLETAAKEQPLPTSVGGLECFRQKRYGDTRLSYFSSLNI